MEHGVLRDLLEPIRALFEDVQRKALMRLEYEGLHRAEAITAPGARFHGDPAGFAMERYAYYVCFKCKKVRWFRVPAFRRTAERAIQSRRRFSPYVECILGLSQLSVQLFVFRDFRRERHWLLVWSRDCFHQPMGVRKMVQIWRAMADKRKC